MASRKKAAKPQSTGGRVFVLPDGTRYEITGENGKYVFCGATQFRRSRGEILNIPVAAEAEPEEEK